MFSAEYRRNLIITMGIVFLLSAALAFMFRGIELPIRLDDLLKTAGATVLFAGGPFSGWVLWVSGGAYLDNLVLLVPWTFLAIWPFVRAAKATTTAARRRILALAVMVWLAPSIFYLVILWT
jgi:hypothetical protein